MEMFTLPGYEIDEIIAEGGMSHVYKAKHIALDRTVAIKVLTKELSQSEDDLESFKNEIRIAARVKHPHIVQVYDAGQIDKRPYYIMEYISGANIGELLLMRKRMELNDALLVLEKVAESLHYCWKEYGLIHCDLKPENIIVDVQGNIKITDLGLSRVIGLTRSELEDDEMTTGTPGYISPEQAVGIEKIDVRTDIYSLAALLYHMLLGHQLFNGQSDEEMLQSHVKSFAADIKDTLPALNDGFAWMLEKMLAKNRDDRYLSWESLLADIKQIKKGAMIIGGEFPAGISSMSRGSYRKIPTAHIPPAPLAVAKKVSAETPEAELTQNLTPEQLTAAASILAATPKKAQSSTAKLLGKKFKINKTASQSMKSSTAKPLKAGDPNDVSKSMVHMALLAIMCVVLYGITYITTQGKTSQNIPTPASKAVPTNAPAKKVTKPIVKKSPTKKKKVKAKPLPEKKSPEVKSTAPTTVTVKKEAPPEKKVDAVGGWNNVKFQKALKDLKEADAKLQRYVESKGDPKVLDQIEISTRAAVKVLEGLKSIAPPTSEINKYIREGLKVIADCRWKKQLL